MDRWMMDKWTDGSYSMNVCSGGNLSISKFKSIHADLFCTYVCLSVQGLLLVLCSVITLGRAQGNHMGC